MGAEPGKGPSDMERMIKQAKAWMPQLFKLLDADGSGASAWMPCDGRRGV